MVAGTSTIRTRVASRVIATIMPVPITLVSTICPLAIPAATVTRSSAAATRTDDPTRVSL